MLEWLRGLLRGRGGDEQLLTLERQVQQLRLALKERDAALARLRDDLERRRSGGQAQVTEQVQVQREQLLSDVAAPVAQLLTQAHLREVEDKPVEARDVLTVAKRLVRTLQDHGLTLEGEMGQKVAFDPRRHELLDAGVSLEPGQPVVLRFVGLAYQGKRLRKAGVERAER